MNTWKDAIVITSVGVGGLAVFGWPVFRTVRARSWPNTRGAVVESAVEADGPPSSDTTSFNVRLRYSYVVGGKRYEGTRGSFIYLSSRHSLAKSAQAQMKSHPRGSALDVYYDPTDPANAVVDLDIPFGWWIVLSLAALFAVGGALPMLRAALG